MSHPSYAASDALIEDWCANKVWFWLNDKFWAFLPSGQRLFNAQVRGALCVAREQFTHCSWVPNKRCCILAAPAQCTQVSSGTSTRDYARQVLATIRANPQYQPLAASAAEAADDLLQDAARSSRPSSSGLGLLGGGSDVSRGQRWRDQGGLAGPSDALVAYYRPVLTKLMEAALRFYLQVQATADSALVLVPGVCV